ncbi:MAG TPA: hypothetical protein PLU93_02160 [Treponemataceae bacterium]|jgi:hypothetical protein|nr:hypothetical protein [Treponemataceae bacterium]
MKRAALPLFAFALLLAARSAAAIEFSGSVTASSFAIDEEGDFPDALPRFGGSVEVAEQIGEVARASIQFSRDPGMGNLLGARISWNTAFISVSAGPSLGVLNRGEGSRTANLFQPGIGLGFTVTAPGILVAVADTDFSIPVGGSESGQVHLQRGKVEVGFYVPHILCRAGISQRRATTPDDGLTITRSVTDYGLYTEAFKKGSPFRIGLNFIYRVTDYEVSPDAGTDRSIGSLVVGGNVTFAPKADVTVFIGGNSSIYSFSLSGPDDGLDRFFFDATVGVKLVLRAPGA